MHASQLHGNETPATKTHGAACSYPLETIMALQKMLENGIPEQNSAETSYSPVRKTPVNPPASANLTRTHTRIANSAREWLQKIRNLLARDRRAKEANGKGNSAQQTG